MDIGGHLMGNKRTQHLDLRAANAFIRPNSLLKTYSCCIYAKTAFIVNSNARRKMMINNNKKKMICWSVVQPRSSRKDRPTIMRP